MVKTEEQTTSKIVLATFSLIEIMAVDRDGSTI